MIMDDDFLLSVIGSDNSEDILCLDKFIGDNIFENLIVKLKCNQKIHKKRLVVRGNCLTSVGAFKLASYLKENDTLEFISLEWNQIGPGALYLGDALEFNTTLLHLDLRNNGLIDSDVVNLADVLKNKNTSLKILDLRWNQLTDQGVELFRPSVMNRSPPLVVHFSGNQLSADILNQVDDWIVKLDKTRYHTKGGNRQPPLPPFSTMIGGVYQTNTLNQSINSMQTSLEQYEDDEDNDEFYNNDLTSQHKLIMQLKIKNSLLRKEIQTMRQQNIYLQTSVTSIENQLCNDSLHTTELEQQIINEQFKYQQLTDNYNQAIDKNNKLETERHEYLVAHNEVLREKDHELKKLSTENVSYKNILERSEENWSRERHQLQSTAEVSEADKINLREELRDTQSRLATINNESKRLIGENTSLSATMTRLKEKLVYVEEELKLSQEAAEESLLAEMRRHDEELENQRNDLNIVRVTYENRLNKLNIELDIVRRKGLDKENELSTKLNLIQQASDDRIEQIRTLEHERTDLTIKDLQERLSVTSQSLKEQEVQNSQYLTELNQIKREHIDFSQSTQETLKLKDSECERLRSMNELLQNNLNTIQSTSKIQGIDIENMKTKIINLEEEIQSQIRVLETINREKQFHYDQYLHMKTLYEDLLNQKKIEFDSMQQSLSQIVLNEFENYKLRYLPKEMLQHQITSVSLSQHLSHFQSTEAVHKVPPVVANVQTNVTTKPLMSSPITSVSNNTSQSKSPSPGTKSRLTIETDNFSSTTKTSAATTTTTSVTSSMASATNTTNTTDKPNTHVHFSTTLSSTSEDQLDVAEASSTTTSAKSALSAPTQSVTPSQQSTTPVVPLVKQLFNLDPISPPKYNIQPNVIALPTPTFLGEPTMTPLSNNDSYNQKSLSQSLSGKSLQDPFAIRASDLPFGDFSSSPRTPITVATPTSVQSFGANTPNSATSKSLEMPSFLMEPITYKSTKSANITPSVTSPTPTMSARSIEIPSFITSPTTSPRNKISQTTRLTSVQSKNTQSSSYIPPPSPAKNAKMNRSPRFGSSLNSLPSPFSPAASEQDSDSASASGSSGGDESTYNSASQFESTNDNDESLDVDKYPMMRRSGQTTNLLSNIKKTDHSTLLQTAKKSNNQYDSDDNSTSQFESTNDYDESVEVEKYPALRRSGQTSNLLSNIKKTDNSTLLQTAKKSNNQYDSDGDNDADYDFDNSTSDTSNNSGSVKKSSSYNSIKQAAATHTKSRNPSGALASLKSVSSLNGGKSKFLKSTSDVSDDYDEGEDDDLSDNNFTSTGNSDLRYNPNDTEETEDDDNDESEDNY